jgi:hypothetical protein
MLANQNVHSCKLAEIRGEENPNAIVLPLSKSQNALAGCQIRQYCAGFGNPAQQIYDLV